MKRILTAALLIPAVSYVVLWAPEFLFLAVTAAVAILCFREYAALVARHGIQPPGPAGYAAGLLVLLIPGSAFAPAIMLVTLCALTLGLRAQEPPHALPRAAAFLLGVFYGFGCWRAAPALRSLSPYWVFYALVLTWVGDSAAYYVGRAAGRHKLAPRLSPAKSWEGSAASVAASLALGYGYLWWLLPAVSPAERVGISLAANLAGQIGDLAESMLKRGAGVKDSGALLPGHGGCLDRVDSTLFAMPAVYFLLWLLGKV